MDLSRIDSDSFSVGLVDNNHYYAVLIDEEEYQTVRNYNNYLEAIKQNAVKEETIILKVQGGLTSIMIAIVFLMFVPIMSNMDKGESPFTRNSVKALRKMYIILIFAVCLPPLLSLFARAFSYAEYLMLRPSLQDFALIVVATIIGVISEMFCRGCELQEEMDMIA